VKKTLTHYSGGLYYKKSNGSTVEMLPGWPACCSGGRAFAIQANGAQTEDETKVTCKSCLRVMEKAGLLEEGT
jgi:hypothetical protein